MQEKINKIINDINNIVIDDNDDVVNFQKCYLSKKGILSELFLEFKELPNAEKKLIGKLLNELKNTAYSKIKGLKNIENKALGNQNIDLTLPANYNKIGAIHPLTKVQNQIISIFEKVGFLMSEGPEIEDDWYNFSALNMPKNHPARDMQDTFFIKLNPDILLRTHTSSIQIRYMEKNSPPITETPTRTTPTKPPSILNRFIEFAFPLTLTTPLCISLTLARWNSGELMTIRKGSFLLIL